MSEESCAICRAFNRQLRVPRSPHCITKERRSGAKHRKTYDLCMSSHFGKVTRSRSGHKYFRNHWWCELLPSGSKLYFCLQPEKTDPVNGAKSQFAQYHALLITSSTAESQFHWNIPPARRLWRQANLHNAARWWHDFPRPARTRRRPLLLAPSRELNKTKDEENKEQKKNNKHNTSMYIV